MTNRFVKILFIIVCLSFLTTSIYLYLSKQTERDMRISLEKRLNDILKEKDILERSLHEALDAKEQLEMNIAEIQKTVETYEASVGELKNAKDSLESKVDAKDEAISDLNAELDNLKSEKENISAQLTRHKQDISDLKEQLTLIRKEKQALEEKFKQFQAQREIELKRIVVKPQTTLKEGQVVIVNREYEFVIINLGQRDGLKIGTVLDIYRDQNLIGKVQIEKLYEALCSANILPEYKKQPIQEGDIAKLSSS